MTINLDKDVFSFERTTFDVLEDAPLSPKVESLPLVEKLKESQKEPIPIWCCLGDDDEEEEEDAKKIAKKYQPMGAKQGAFLFGGFASTALLSGFFFRAPLSRSAATPTIVQEFAGASMDLAKKGYAFVPEGYKKLSCLVAYVALPVFFIASQLATFSSENANAVIKTIPWIFPTMGALRVDFHRYIHLSVASKKWNIGTSYKRAVQALDAVWKMAGAAAVVGLVDNSLLQACSAIIFKSEARRIVDLAEEKILTLEGNKRQVALVAIAGILGVMLTAGVANVIWGKERVFDLILLTPPIDTVIRTGKANLKRYLNHRKEKKIEEGESSQLQGSGKIKFCAKVGGVALLLSALGAIAAQVGAFNAGFATALLIDLVSILKVASKEISPIATISMAGVFLSVTSITYIFQEFVETSIPKGLYLTLFGIGALTYSTAMYQVRKKSIPPKKPKVEKAPELFSSEV